MVVADPTTPGQKLAIDSSGRITVLGSGSFTADTELAAAVALSDSISNPTVPIVGAAHMHWDAANSLWKRGEAGNQDNIGGSLFHQAVIGMVNGGSGNVDRAYNNFQNTTLSNSLVTVTTRTGSAITNRNARAIILTLKTANKLGATATYTLSLQFQNNSGNWQTLWSAAAAVTTASTFVYVLGPGVGTNAAVAESVGVFIPRTVRVVLTVASADGANAMDTLVDYDLVV